MGGKARPYASLNEKENLRKTHCLLLRASSACRGKRQKRKGVGEAGKGETAHL